MSEISPEQPHSVTSLTGLIKHSLQTNFSDVWVTGETSDVGRPGSGHLYFNLKDEQSILAAVIWKNVAQRLSFPVAGGLHVLCRGQIDVYPPRGSYQLIVRQIEPLGAGVLELAFKELHRRLAGEGLFDPAHKQPLPPFPKFVVVITSPSGAAIHDFLQVAARRWQGAAIAVLPTRVQGNVAGEIAAAIRTANRLRPAPDAIVLTRGGGSLEDLWCFNEEEVVRAIFASHIPLVSAIGHEIDVTLSDLVADVRALTPTEAAERLFPSRDELERLLGQYGERLKMLVRSRTNFLRSRLEGLASRPALARPWERLRDLSRRLDDFEARLRRTLPQRISLIRQGLNGTAARLEALSPLAVLARGYSLSTRVPDGKIVTDANHLRTGDELLHRFATGSAVSTVKSIRPADSP